MGVEGGSSEKARQTGKTLGGGWGGKSSQRTKVASSATSSNSSVPCDCGPHKKETSNETCGLEKR